MVWLCKLIFLLNKRIRFCSGSNLFWCIHLLHVCASTMAGFPPTLPSPSPHTTLSSGNGPQPCLCLWLPYNWSPVVCLKQPFWASSSSESVQLAAGRRISIFNSCLFCLAKGTILFCHWSLAALLEVLKPSRSDWELPLMGYFSWSIGWVWFWPTNGESIWQVLFVCCCFCSTEN